MALSAKQFAKKVKEKYPDYADVDDLELAKKIVEIHPDYAQEVDFGLEEPSDETGGFGQDLAKQGVVGIKKIAGGLVPDVPETTADLTPPGFPALSDPTAQRYGGAFLAGALGTPSGNLAAVPALEASVGLNTPVGRGALRVSDEIDKIAAEVSPKDPDFRDKLMSGIGSMSTFLIPSAIGAKVASSVPAIANIAIKMGPALGTGISTVLESGTEAGGIFKDVLKKTGNPQEAAKAAQGAFFGNAILIGITNRFGVFGEAVTGVKKALASAPLEAIQEFGQSIIEDVQKGNEIDWGKAVEAFGLGGIIGGGAGLVMPGSETQPVRKVEVPPKVISQAQETPQIFGGFIDKSVVNTEQASPEIKDIQKTPAPENIVPESEIPLSEVSQNEPISIKSDVEYNSPDEVPVPFEEETAVPKERVKSGRPLSDKQNAAFQSELDRVTLKSQEDRIKNEKDFAELELNMTTLDDMRGKGMPGGPISDKEFSQLFASRKKMVSDFAEKVLPEKLNAEIQRKLNFATTTKAVRSIIRDIDTAISTPEAVPGIPIKKAIEANTGINRMENVVQAKESQLLADRFKAEILGAKKGFQEGKRVEKDLLIRQFKAGQQRINEAIQYINEQLPQEYRGKFINAIQKARTPARQFSLIDRVDQLRRKIDTQENLAEAKELAKPDPRVSLDYQAKINDLVAGLDFKKMTDATRSKLSSLKEFLEKTKGENAVPLNVVKSVDRLSKIPARDMTLEESAELRQNLETLKKLGILKRQLKMKYVERERKIAERRLLDSTVNVDPDSENRLLNQAKQYYINTLHAPRVADMLDGYKNYNGENAKLVKGFMRAGNRADGEMKLRTQRVAEEIQKVKKDWSQDDLISIMFHLYKEQPGGHVQAQSIIDAYGLKSEPKLTPEIRESMIIARRAMDEKYADIAALVAETENRQLEKVENYFPIKYEREQNLAPSLVDERAAYKTTQTNKGFTYGRKQNVKKIPRVDFFNIMDEAIRQQEWYLNMQPQIENAKYLVKTPQYRQAAGQLGANFWSNYLDVVARNGWATGARANFALKQGRLNLSNAVLGYKLSSILMQPMAVFEALSYAQAKHGAKMGAQIAKEFTKTWINPKYAKEYIEGSQALKSRRGGELSMEEVFDSEKNRKNFFSKVIKGGMSLMQKADVQTAAGIQRGVENVLRENGVKNAKEEAEFIMNMVSGSSDVAARPLILSEGEFQRMMFTFQTFALNRWGVAIHDIINSGLVHGDYKTKLNSVLALGIMAAGYEAGNEAAKWVREKITGKKLKDSNVVEDSLMMIPAMVPFFGNLIELATHPGYSSTPPLWKALEDVSRGAGSALKGKSATTRRKGVLKAAKGALSVYPGLPGTAQAFDLLEGYINR